VRTTPLIKILLAVDGSAHAEGAMRHVIRSAHACMAVESSATGRHLEIQALHEGGRNRDDAESTAPGSTTLAVIQLTSLPMTVVK